MTHSKPALKLGVYDLHVFDVKIHALSQEVFKSWQACSLTSVFCCFKNIEWFWANSCFSSYGLILISLIIAPIT